MKNYEGLFILNTAGTEDSIQDIVDRVAASITEEGGNVTNVQKMDKKSFARVADRRYGSGFYVNIIFEAEPELMNRLQTKYTLDAEVFRVIFSQLKTAIPADAEPAT